MTDTLKFMSDVREQTLLTLVELGVRGNTRESMCLAMDAHELLGGTWKDEFFKDRQLKEMYPQFVIKSSEEQELVEVSKGKEKPISIHHIGDAIAYYKAPIEVRNAWNAYAQREADILNNSGVLDSYDSTNTIIGRNRDGQITSWCPPLFFPEWYEKWKVDHAA